MLIEGREEKKKNLTQLTIPVKILLLPLCFAQARGAALTPGRSRQNLDER